MSNTVDYGIDLGTTNSGVARMTKNGPQVVKDRYEQDVLPSAVGMNPQGNILVGKDAYEKPDFQAVSKFKRDMGTDRNFQLRDRSEWSAVDLSAEVLKELKAAVHMRYGHDLRHAVITVPAMFMQPQIEATHQAALRAGIDAVSLLQEPIAAATAYLNDDPIPGKYLVFDLGGGTFDVSIVELRDDQMFVLGHGGDNYLGGSDFDRVLVDWCIDQIRTQGVSTTGLNSTIAQHILFRECERTKVRLSQVEEAEIDLADLQVGASPVPISRESFLDLVEELIERTISLTRERLEDCGLQSEDIQQILLVGGPTKAPYLRDRLKEEFDRPVNLELDPMTVVAIGAAVTASTILVPQDVAANEIAARDKSKAIFELTYDPTVSTESCFLGGKLQNPDCGLEEVRIKRGADWDTGWIRLIEGAFLTELTLNQAPVTEFTLDGRKSTGDSVPITPPGLSIRLGIAPAQGVAPYNYGTVIKGGTSSWIIKEGESLPHSNVSKFRAVHGVQAKSEQNLKIYFLEGRSSRADECMKAGTLVIDGKDLTRSINKGDEIEIRLTQDASRRIKARVFLPLQDKDYSVEFFSMLDAPNLADVRDQLKTAEEALVDIDDLVTDEERDLIARLQSDSERIEADIELAEGGEPGVAERVGKRISDLNAEVSRLKSKYESDVSYTEAKHAVEESLKVAREVQDMDDIRTCNELLEELERAKKLNDVRSMASIREKAVQISAYHFSQVPEFWLGYTEWLRERVNLSSNPSAFMEYVHRAETAIRNGDLQTARINARQAHDLLPEYETGAGRFDDSGLSK